MADRVRRVKSRTQRPEGVKANPRLKSHPSLRPFRLGEGLPALEDLRHEVQNMIDVLNGHEPPPIDHGVTSLMEVASAYYGRGLEIKNMLHEAEAKGQVLRASQTYKFRTGELADFLDLAKNAFENGSRLLSRAQYDLELMKIEGRA